MPHDGTDRVGLILFDSRNGKCLGRVQVLAEPNLTRTLPHTQAQLADFYGFISQIQHVMVWAGLRSRLTHWHPYPLFILINTLPVGYTKNFHRCTPHARLHEHVA